MALLVPTVGAVLLVDSGYAGYRGLGWLRRYMEVTSGSATAAEDVTEPGTVSLSGTVVADEAFSSPFSGEECVVWKWTVGELRRNSLNTVGSAVYAAPFAVDDGTGRVAVDSLDHDDGVPAEVRRLATVEQFPQQREAVVETPDPVPQEGEREYSEQLVKPGDEVSVLGDARPDADATPPLDPEDLTVRPPGRERSTLPDLPVDLPLGRPGRETAILSTAGETAATRLVRDRMLLVPWSVLLGLSTLAWLFGYRVLPAAVLTPVLLGVFFLLVATIVYVLSG
jgi:hypothetical protein